MQIMPIFEIYEKTEVYKNAWTLEQFKPTKRLFLRTITVTLTAFGAMKVPKFGLFINLIGAFACTALAFVLPVRMYDKLYASELTVKWKITHLALVVFGCIVGTISFIISFISIVKEFNEDTEELPETGSLTEITSPSNSTSLLI